MDAAHGGDAGEADAAPISHRRGTPLYLATPCRGISSSPSGCVCHYSKSLSTAAARVAKIELGAGRDPPSSLLAPPQRQHSLGCPAGHRAWLVKAAVNEITSTSPAR